MSAFDEAVEVAARAMVDFTISPLWSGRRVEPMDDETWEAIRSPREVEAVRAALAAALPVLLAPIRELVDNVDRRDDPTTWGRLDELLDELEGDGR